MDDDILEVGEDGVFEITTTKTVKQTPMQLPNYDHAGELDDEEINKEELLDSINPGEYKIYKSKGFVYIIAKMQDNETVKSAGCAAKEVVIETTTNKKLTVSLKNVDSINEKSGSCTVWKEYVTLKYALA